VICRQLEVLNRSIDDSDRQSRLCHQLGDDSMYRIAIDAFRQTDRAAIGIQLVERFRLVHTAKESEQAVESRTSIR